VETDSSNAREGVSRGICMFLPKVDPRVGFTQGDWNQRLIV